MKSRCSPFSDSATASSLGELQQISTDPNPFPGAYERTVAEVVTSGTPSFLPALEYRGFDDHPEARYPLMVERFAALA